MSAIPFRVSGDGNHPIEGSPRPKKDADLSRSARADVAAANGYQFSSSNCSNRSGCVAAALATGVGAASMVEGTFTPSRL